MGTTSELMTLLFSMAMGYLTKKLVSRCTVHPHICRVLTTNATGPNKLRYLVGTQISIIDILEESRI